MLWLTSFGSTKYHTSLDVLRASAYRKGQVDRVVLWTEEEGDIPQTKSFSKFKKDNKHLFHSEVKGSGYYSLKAFVIFSTLQLLKDDDTLIYCDSTCLVQHSLQQKFQASPEIQLFQLWPNGKFKNEDWTKPGLFELMNSDAFGVQQLNAAIQVYKKTPRAVEFLHKYLWWSTEDKAMRDDGFPSHRHDQSILTILASAHDVSVDDDVTQHGPAGPQAPFLHHRQIIDPGSVLKLDIITPTVVRNREQLTTCVDSVQRQSGLSPHVLVWHWIVLDGPNLYFDYDEYTKIPVKIFKLPARTGNDNWNGHRIYAAMSFLSNSSHVSFLDDDNWLEPNHVSSVVNTLLRGTYDMVFSLRKIREHSGEFICDDLCESLGNHHHSVLDQSDFFCDTSCMTLSRHVAADLAHLWNVRAREPGKIEADRAVSRAALLRKHCVGTRCATVNYRLGGAPHSVKAKFFEEGNRAMQNIGSAWSPDKKDLYVFHFGPEQTVRALQNSDRSLQASLAEWQPALFNSVKGLNLINGYTHMHVIPTGAVVYASMCFPQQLPLEQVFARTDLKRIVYTVESPNLAHSEQWKIQFLEAYFDVWLTYWKPLLKHPRAFMCYHNTHHLTPDDQGSISHLLLENKARDQHSVCMVLANRSGNKSYTIDGEVLTQLDYLRSVIIQDLDITVYGNNWTNTPPNIRVASTVGKNDGKSSVEILQKYSFVVIVENCNAQNYVSEKIYDAFIAGCIPLYYGRAGEVPIPENMYIDLTGFQSSEEVKKHLQQVHPEAMRRTLYSQRETVLKMVSTEAFAECLQATM